jgi:tetratricopeptide (TPR) repeat protein
LVKDPQQSIPEDRLLLIRILEADGRYQEARREFLPLVNKQNPNPAHMAQFVDLLMRHKDLTAAKSWLDKIIEVAPENLGTWNLRVRYLKESGQASEIKPLLDRFAVSKFKEIQQDSQKPQFCLAIGKLYTSVEMHHAAEFWYRGLVKFSPESYQPLVRSLASQDRMTEAIELCQEKAASEASPRAAITLAQALTMGKASASDYDLADTVFREAQEKYQGNVDLLFSLAYVRTVQQRLEEAVRLYLEIHQQKPRHVPTLNNLAAVLSEIPSRRKEALNYVDRAIDITGRQPALLDTKSMVVLEDDPDEAVELLEEATAVPSPDPRYHFHLAVAYQRVGSLEKARKALEQARNNDLANFTLTTAEQRMLKELEKSL